MPLISGESAGIMSVHDDHEALLAATVRLIRDPDGPERIQENAQQWFESVGLTPEHAEMWAQAEPKRLLLYRKLVRNGLSSTIRKLIPLTAARLGPVFDVWVQKYCQDELPVSHYLRDVAGEFVDWVLPHWKQDISIPAYILDLARYEVFEFQIAIAANEPSIAVGPELQLDRGVIFASSVRLAHFDYAVQRLPDDESDREIPAQEPVTLLGYRNADYEAQCLELNKLAAEIINGLLLGKKLGAAIVEAHGGPVSPEGLHSIAEMLANLAEHKVILGSA
jgi:hypothetical protein